MGTLKTATSSGSGTPTSVRAVMLWVLAALIPGLCTALFWYGPTLLENLLLAIGTALATEALCLRLRRVPAEPALLDGTAVVTAALITLACPPTLPPSLLIFAVVTAIGLGKQIYGGVGNNPFNPAVVGYAVILLCFPAAVGDWPGAVDGLSGATALTTFKYRAGLTVDGIWQSTSGFGAIGGHPAEWLNAGFLAGGLLLASRGLLAWRVPVAFLATLGLLAALGYDRGSSASLGSPLFHWFSGATMLGAWFFATDPVTHPASFRGQILFGCLVGALTWAIRSFGNYPDGMAFALLLGNGAAAWLDRVYVRGKVTE